MSKLKLTTIANVSDSESTDVTNVINGSAKAWVYLNAGGGTPVIYASFNVSSITDTGTGTYTVNFTNAFPDSYYTVAGISAPPGSANSVLQHMGATTTGCNIRSAYLYSNTLYYHDTLNTIVFHR